jgi:hypothetical protein
MQKKQNIICMNDILLTAVFSLAAFFFGALFFFGAAFFGADFFVFGAAASFLGLAAALVVFFPSALSLYEAFDLSRIPSSTPFFNAAKYVAFIHFLSTGMLAYKLYCVSIGG